VIRETRVKDAHRFVALYQKLTPGPSDGTRPVLQRRWNLLYTLYSLTDLGAGDQTTSVGSFFSGHPITPSLASVSIAPTAASMPAAQPVAQPLLANQQPALTTTSSLAQPRSSTADVAAAAERQRMFERRLELLRGSGLGPGGTGGGGGSDGAGSPSVSVRAPGSVAPGRCDYTTFQRAVAKAENGASLRRLGKLVIVTACVYTHARRRGAWNVPRSRVVYAWLLIPPWSIPTYDGRGAVSDDVSEFCLLRDAVYALQGVEGTFVHYDAAARRYTVDPHVCPPRMPACLLTRLCAHSHIARCARIHV